MNDALCLAVAVRRTFIIGMIAATVPLAYLGIGRYLKVRLELKELLMCCDSVVPHVFVTRLSIHVRLATTRDLARELLK